MAADFIPLIRDSIIQSYEEAGQVNGILFSIKRKIKSIDILNTSIKFQTK